MHAFAIVCWKIFYRDTRNIDQGVIQARIVELQLIAVLLPVSESTPQRKAQRTQ
ncbi:MAG: hypothetical protein AB2805_11350 [Candidatus Thiodiazotropha sp.]